MIHVLLTGDHKESNIVGVFSSAEKAKEFKDITHINAHDECFEFELDPAIPQPYISGLQPWMVLVKLSDPSFPSCLCQSHLGRAFSEEQINKQIPVLAKFGDHRVIRIMCWARDNMHAQSQAMAIRAGYFAEKDESKRTMKCSACGENTHRVVCDLSKNYTVKHVICANNNKQTEVFPIEQVEPTIKSEEQALPPVKIQHASFQIPPVITEEVVL
jgi:hypothetical protein